MVTAKRGSDLLPLFLNNEAEKTLKQRKAVKWK
jgi:hypothetical protein